MQKKIKCSRCAAQTTLNRFRETWSYENKPKTARKRCTTNRTDRLIERIALQDRRKSSREISSELWVRHIVSISASTVRKRLGAFNLHGRVARKTPYLSETHTTKTLIVGQEI